MIINIIISQPLGLIAKPAEPSGGPRDPRGGFCLADDGVDRGRQLPLEQRRRRGGHERCLPGGGGAGDLPDHRHDHRCGQLYVRQRAGHEGVRRGAVGGAVRGGAGAVRAVLPQDLCRDL